MPDLQTRLDLDRIVNSLDAPIVLAIIVNDDGVPETLTKGLENDKHLFWLLHQMTIQVAQAVYESFTAEERSRMRIVLPTAEDARRLGVLNPPSRGKR